jgi:hypothetical protein
LKGHHLISLMIGTSFLVTFFFAAQLVAKMLGSGQWAKLVRESLVIGGWVAMWVPLEIFLYDWCQLWNGGSSTIG